MILNNKLYDVMKWIALIALPATATLWFTIAKIWGLPYIAEITGTLVAVDTFIGALLGISNIQYQLEEYKNAENNNGSK
jgi:hypothetical protein